MSVSVIAKFVAIVSLCSPFLLATPAAAQRVVQRYEAYPQQRSSGNHGGGFLESLFSGGQPPPAGYSASYPQSGSPRYNDASYRQAAYEPAGGVGAPPQRGGNPRYLRQEGGDEGPERPGARGIDTQ